MRLEMVEKAVIEAGVTDPDVIKSMRQTPRHEFVPKAIRHQSYLDAGLPIGEQQTISSPFIVAYMTQSLEPQSTDKVLEIGTGSGYQAAVLSPIVKEVYSIEIVESLGRRAARTLRRLDYQNVFTRVGDGFKGWPEHAPFDKIIVTCSPEDIPEPLVEQLVDGGLMVIPVGERHQQTLYLMKKVGGKMQAEALRPTLFVPMTGRAEQERKVLPDPTKPALLNGDFEEGLDEKGFVKGWYYQRKMELKEGILAPGGTHYVEFTNDVPGQYSHLMQGFAIDGRKVPRIRLEASMACEKVVRGPHRSDLPHVALTFYDGQRKDLSTYYIGPMEGSMTWRKKDLDVPVPVASREAIVRIGLFGATGAASFDLIDVRAVE
jgi:protein-L-isoaspartate(D-aspartate) O-methyltransferase